MRRRTILAAVFGTTATVVALVGGLTRRFAVVEDSMRPALESGDWLLARRRRGVPERGTVIVFPHPDDPAMFLVKRVIGLPGESLTVAEGQVHIDAQTLAEPWVSGLTIPDGEHTIPSDAVWVLGDNRALSSADSRTLGPVPVDDIPWRAVAVYWPQARIGLL